MVSQRMLQLGTARSVIRELFEYGRQRTAEVGAENVFDFSLGNPSVPAPAAVNETAIRLLREQGDTIHCYTSAPGDTGARQRIADSLNRRFGEHYTADELYLTVGAAASLCCVFNGLTCPGDEYILFAPYFPEYKVFIEGARGKVQVIAPEIEQFQIDFTAFEKAVNCRTKGVDSYSLRQRRLWCGHQLSQQSLRCGLLPADVGDAGGDSAGQGGTVRPPYLPHFR